MDVLFPRPIRHYFRDTYVVRTRSIFLHEYRLRGNSAQVDILCHPLDYIVRVPKNSCESRAPPSPPRRHDRATTAPHVSTRCSRRMNCHRCPTRRAGVGERRPPGDGSLPPRDRGGSARTKGFTASPEALPTRGGPHTKFKAKFPY